MNTTARLLLGSNRRWITINLLRNNAVVGGTRQHQHRRIIENGVSRGIGSNLSVSLSIRCYSTEKIISLRSKVDPEVSGKELPKSVYRSEYEKENCGVGMVASLKSIPSRKVVVDADEMLVRMSHRGGCGCDPNSGDGAGMLFGMPDSFMRKVALENFNKELPEAGKHAVGNVFFPHQNTQALVDCKAVLERLLKEKGINVMGWRKVPVDNSMLGQDPVDSEPITQQIFVTVKNNKNNDERSFERESSCGFENYVKTKLLQC